MSFSERLDSLLKSKNMTAKQLTEELKIEKTTITQWKRGVSTPSPKILIAISRIFNVSIDWLLTGEDDSYPPTESNLPPRLSETEEIILDTYRKADKKTRVDILKKVLDMAKSS